MWELVNQTAYATESSWTRDKTGQHLWLVAVKATFDIAPGGSVKLADEQPPPLLEAEYWGKPGASSLRYDVDVVPPKPTTDVLVTGSAYAPGGHPATKVAASLQVAEVHKTIIVHGPRVYYAGGLRSLSVSAAQPFTRHPIRYEDAFGGFDLDDPDPRHQSYDARNPAGKGVTTKPKELHHQPAHRIEYPDGGTRHGPAGFGPIDAAWSPRRERAGTYDEVWEKRKKPLLPDDFSDLYHLSAPDDQRPRQHLRGEELLTLVNMTPEGALRVQLPKIYLAFATEVAGRTEEHRSTLGTVIVDSDAKKLMLVWQTSLPVAGKDVDYLDETTVTEKSYI